MKWRTSILAAVVLVGVPVSGVALLVLLPIYRFEKWVDDRVKLFGDLSYENWKGIYDGCALIADNSGDFGWSQDSEGYDQLPSSIKELEPRSVYVRGDSVYLHFSGGHSRFVMMEYRRNREPPELHLLMEHSFAGLVFPRTDQRTLRQMRFDPTP
jgi:hypothetical protein